MEKKKSKSIINQNLILSQQKIKDKKELFKLIVEAIEEDKRTNNSQKLLADLVKREQLGSTAFENGLMIPHAQSEFIKCITLVIVPFEDIDFQALDHQPTNFAVAIIVPLKIAQAHLTILSKISSLFSNLKNFKQFKKAPAAKKIEILEKVINVKKVEKPEIFNYDIVAITSCAAGIAHTYMARDALIQAAKKQNLKIKVETQGAITENKLTNEEINRAKCIIVAADTKVDQSVFGERLVYNTSTNEVIRNGEKVVATAWKQQANQKQKKLGTKINNNKFKKPKKQNEILRALMTAISYMLPIIVAGGLLFAIPSAIKAGTVDSSGNPQPLPAFWAAMEEFGLQGFSMLAIPIIGMYMAYSIGGKPAMAAGLIGTFFANNGELLSKYSYLPNSTSANVGAGFLGGILIGIFAGYLVKYMQWIKWHRFIAPAAPILIVPLFSTFCTFVFVVYVVGAPLSWLMSQIYNGLATISASSIWLNIGIGAIFAGMVAFDLGGPVGKVSWFVSNGIFVDTVASGNPNLMPWTAMTAAISVGPLAMFYATTCFRWKFSTTEREAGKACLPLGLVGISEGALPFAFGNPLIFITSNVIGGAIAGALVTAFNISYWGGLGSPIGAWAGYVDDGYFGFLWAICIIVGVLISGTLFTLLRKKNPEYQRVYEEAKKAKRAWWKKQGINPGIKNLPKKLVYHTKSFAKKFKPGIKYMVNPKNWIKRPTNWGV